MLRVFLHVANDVGELEGEAAALGERLSGGIAITEYPDAHQADHRRHAVAVEMKIFEGPVLDDEFLL